jgi:hypothetical protein
MRSVSDERFHVATDHRYLDQVDNQSSINSPLK